MAWAICSRCSREVHWSARRGTRLADLRCHLMTEGGPCGGELRAKTSSSSAAKGRTRTRCSVETCARLTQTPRRPAFAFRVRVGVAFVTFSAETPICWRHDVEQADPVARFELLQRACGERIDAELGYGFHRLSIAPELDTRCLAQPPPGWGRTRCDASWRSGPASDAEAFGPCALERCPLMR